MPDIGRRRRREPFNLFLIKPSHYDDEGYVIQWARSEIPSNTMAALNGIAIDCIDRGTLGEAVDLRITAQDETNTRVQPRKIIRAIKNGEAPDPALAALAGLRSKHNTYMSVPLVFLMLNAHQTWAAGIPGLTKTMAPFVTLFLVFFGWSVTWMLYKRSAKLKEGHPAFLPEG